MANMTCCKECTTKASRPTPNSVGQFSAKLGGGAAHARRSAREPLGLHINQEDREMAKWADYGISAVRYDSDDQYIDQVKVHKDNGDTIEFMSSGDIIRNSNNKMHRMNWGF